MQLYILFLLLMKNISCKSLLWSSWDPYLKKSSLSVASFHPFPTVSRPRTLTKGTRPWEVVTGWTTVFYVPNATLKRSQASGGPITSFEPRVINNLRHFNPQSKETSPDNSVSAALLNGSGAFQAIPAQCARFSPVSQRGQSSRHVCEWWISKDSHLSTRWGTIIIMRGGWTVMQPGSVCMTAILETLPMKFSLSSTLVG